MENFLCLREVRFRSPEPWVNPGEGLWFVFPKTGVGEFVSGAMRHRLSAKVALVANVRPGAMSIRPATPEFCFQCFQVGLETLFPLMACREIPRLLATADGLKTGKTYPAALDPVAHCLALLQQIPTQDNLEHRTVLLRVAAMLLEHELQAVNGQQLLAGTAGERVRQILDGISSADLMNASADELAHKFGYSRRHLHRLFQAQFGFSVAALRLEIRLQKASQLLRDPGAKVTNVAVEAGFNHQSTFNNYFRRRFGLSPSQWRKTLFNPAPQPALEQGTLPLLASQRAGTTDATITAINAARY